MKRFQSILCASLLTLAMSSVALAGNISGAPSTDGNISGKGGNISGAPGNISGAPGNISGTPGNISGFAEEVYLTLIGLLGAVAQ
jgi:hypothetical protein